MKKALALMIAALVTIPQFGCTTQAWYDAARLRAESECATQPPGAFEECRARINKQKYEDYEKTRSGTKN
jgi:hypothetical protein